MALFDDENENLRDLIKVGEVSSVDTAKGTARVVFDDEEGIVSNDLQVLQRNTIENQGLWLPDVGEDVVCLFIPNGEEDGFIIGSFYSDEIEPPKDGATKRYVVFKDEAEFVYDWESHELTAKIGNTKFKATQDSVEIESSNEIKVTAPAITFVGDLSVDGDVTTTGKVAADGEVTAKAKMTPVNLSTHIHPTGIGPSEPPTPGT